MRDLERKHDACEARGSGLAGEMFPPPSFTQLVDQVGLDLCLQIASCEHPFTMYLPCL